MTHILEDIMEGQTPKKEVSWVLGIYLEKKSSSFWGAVGFLPGRIGSGKVRK